MSKNDDVIMKLKLKIEGKKSKLKEIRKSVPITNLILKYEGVTYNLNVMNTGQILNILISLNTKKMSICDLGLDIEEELLSLNGYTIHDWIHDLKIKLSDLEIKEEKRKLKLMELQLDGLLSENKKTELKLDEIANMLE